MKKKAKTVFEDLHDNSALTGLLDTVIQHYMREAGHDPSADDAYQKVLGLDGGKAEYEERLKDLASREVECATTLEKSDLGGPK